MKVNENKHSRLFNQNETKIVNARRTIFEEKEKIEVLFKFRAGKETWSREENKD